MAPGASSGEDGEEIEVPIDSDEDHMDEEKSEASNNKKKIYGGVAIGVVVILALVLGIGYGTGSFGSSGDSGAPAPAPGGTEPPTEPDTPEVDPALSERVGAYNEYLAAVSFDPDALEVPNSPEWTTVRFMANNDPAMLDPTDTSMENMLRINQRYALLLLYFGSDKDAWVNQENWLNADECTWYGVTCGPPVEEQTDGTETDIFEGNVVEEDGARRRHLQSDTTVTVVAMEENGLLGRFPPDLALLMDLVSLNLSGNGLSGPLPASLSTMSSLSELVLGNNAFTGALSDSDFTPLTNLSRLDLQGNEFSGGIPDVIYGLTGLEVLILDNNALTGAISVNVVNMASLARFTAGGNGLTGALPVEFASLENLGTFILLM